MSANITHRGFSLLETLIAMVLVAVSMTALVVAFVATGQFGVLSRRQATAVAVARSIAGTHSHVPYTDARLVNNNNLNDANFTDPNGIFALPTLPAGNDAPDNVLPSVTVGNESFDVYVNIAPLMDTVSVLSEQGRQFAVIVRYKVGSQFMRAVAIGFRYNPTIVGVGQLPL
jgi:prepilin-type N-terminal cleavage/methylation domain-containing protein